MKVIIIGGGIAGLSAAKILYENNINFLLLEGDNNIGGRIKQDNFAGNNIDIGAKWYQKLKNNHVWNNYGPKKVGINGAFANFDKQIIYNSDGNQIKNTINLDKIYKISSERKKQNLPDISIKSAMNKANIRSNRKLLNCIEYNNFDSEYGDISSNISLYNYIAHKQDNSNYFNNGEYIKLIEELSKNFLDKIEYNKIVKEINYLNNKYTITVCNDSTDNKIANTIIYECDYIICTVSLGVLKNKLIKFTPELPKSKINILNKYKMVAFNTIFINFNKYINTWNHEVYLYADKKRGFYPYWLNFTLDKYYGSNKKSNIFCLFLSGKEAIRSEIIDKNIIKKELEIIANKIFKGNNLSITDIYIPKWYTNKLYNGSFSNLSIGFTSKYFKILQKPVNNLYFAGEHICDKNNGYVQGAYNTGKKAANLIIRNINKILR